MLLQDVAWEPTLLEPRRDDALERWVYDELGEVPDFVGYLSACPWLVRAVVEGAPGAGRILHLDAALAETVYLVVSYDNSCRYCYATHRAVLGLLGFPERRIERLEQELVAPASGRPGREALDLARRFSRANPLPSASDLEVLARAGLSREAALEVLFLAASAVLANRATTLPAVPFEGAAGPPAGRALRWLRPITARLALARRRRAAPTAPEPAAGPFGGMLAAFGSLPAGGALRRAFAGCWSAHGLTPGTRALVFAIVARGLGAAAAEREALALAAQAGIPGDRAEAALRHLVAPAGEPGAEPALSFARDTLWYEPSRIQRRSREVRDSLGTERFLDLVGTAGLANAFCRLSAILDRA
jgi:AhpD family alkylhydroperoxidase